MGVRVGGSVGLDRMNATAALAGEALRGVGYRGRR